MVRGPAALLAPPVGALAYFLLAPALPGLPAGDVRAIVAGSIGLVMIGCCALSVLVARGELVGLALLVIGGGLLAAALTAARVGPAADPFRAVMAAALGVILARALEDRRALVALPLVVAGIDAWSVLNGPSSHLISGQSNAVDFLTFELPSWGDRPQSAGHLGVIEIVFLAMFASWAWSFGLRRRLTATLLVASLVLALLAGVAVGEPVPVLPLLAAALLAPNADLLLGLWSTPKALRPLASTPPPASPAPPGEETEWF